MSYESCDECREALTENDCWCWEANENDYNQVPIIVLMIVLMHLASHCLGYAYSSVTIGGMSEMIICSFDIEKMKKLKQNEKQITSDYNEVGTVSGIPIPIYLVASALLSGIYFCVKVLMNNFFKSPHYLSTLKDEFDSTQWDEFYDARIILLSTVYCHSFIMLKQNVSIAQEFKESGATLSKIVGFLCQFVMFVDFMGSIIIMCIQYPLIFTALYHGAVGILSSIGCTFIICCLIPLIVCYAKCITGIFTLKCLRFCCKSDTGSACGRFTRGISNGFVLLTLYYLFFCVVLSLCFLFVGGPNHAVIYLNMSSDSNDRWIVLLYIIAMCIAVFGFLIAICNVIKKQCEDHKSKCGYNHPRNDSTLINDGVNTSTRV